MSFSTLKPICLFFFVFLLFSAKEIFSEQQNTPTLIPEEEAEEFVLFTMPKTGTHLMRPILEYLTDKSSISYWARDVRCRKAYLYDKSKMKQLSSSPNAVQAYWLHQPISNNSFISILDALQNNNDFLVTHAPYSPQMENIFKQRNCAVFFLIRDPRDWVISVIRHPAVSGVDIYGEPIKDRHFLSLDLNQKIQYILNGTDTYYSAAEVYQHFLSWKNSPLCCSLRFEALLGPNGGGASKQEQMVELRKIASALHTDVSDEVLLDAFAESFGEGNTFSQGKVGVWKKYFTEEHKALFKKLLGDILIELGYEKDYNW